MDTKTILVALGALIIGLGVGNLATNSGGARQGGHMMADGSMMGQNIDQHFIVQMIPHHEGAIEMSKIALERSKRPEMLKLANDIIAAQTKEINDMTSWYQSWYGGSVPQGGPPAGGGMMHMDGMTGDVGDLSTVAAADFDREFIDQMIPHHEMAVMMANMLASATDRPEMKQLAQNIIASQSSEIEMMRSWLNEWQ